MRPIANYHTHTYLCKHASGSPSDYIAQAVREGCLELGFSDHCPWDPSFGDCWDNIRMGLDEIPTYQQMVMRAKEEAPFPVYLGFECEWDGDHKSWYTDELLGRWKADYLVLGPHWVMDGSTRTYCPDMGRDKKLLHRYIDQTIEGMRSGLFAFLAHPDLFMMGWKEWDEEARACLRAVLDAAVDLGLPLEVNGLGIVRAPNSTGRGMRYGYPYVEFWEMVAAEPRAKVICNSDAHDPQDVLMNAWRSRDFAGRFGLTPLDKLEFAS